MLLLYSLVFSVISLLHNLLVKMLRKSKTYSISSSYHEVIEQMNKQTDNANSSLAFTTENFLSFYYDTFICNFSFTKIIPWDTSMMKQSGPFLYLKEA